MNKHIILQDNFYSKAKDLRDFFEAQYNNPLEAHEMRFVWDNWYVDNQYCLSRTPAYHYFPEEMYNELHNYLVDWGRENLGCFDISPPWLSNYTDGDFQNWHADVPHGPWAFVFSLTPYTESKFTGGKTLLLKPEILSFWENLDMQSGLERGQIYDSVDPEFNRLTLFDPRFPHRVETIKGSKDPLQGRLVIHGWFTQPRPFVSDFYDEDLITKKLNEQLEPLIDKLSQYETIQGLCSFKIFLSATGKVEKLEPTSNTLVDPGGELDEVEQLIGSHLKNIQLLENSQPYRLTLPLIFS